MRLFLYDSCGSYVIVFDVVTTVLCVVIVGGKKVFGSKCSRIKYVMNSKAAYLCIFSGCK